MSNGVGSFTIRAFEQNGAMFSGFGALSMLGTAFKFAVTEFSSNNPEAPCFTAHAKTPDGRLVEIGKAWRKRIKKGDFAGKDFFSFTFDDPTFPGPLNISAFPEGGVGEYVLTWSRSKRAAAKPLEQSARTVDDEIPF